jgi:uncharacterized metal-binding protein YceD (DUF177 family)
LLILERLDKVLEAFAIKFEGLKEGLHNFEFTLEDSFLSLFGFDEETSSLHGDVKISMEKSVNMLIVNVKGKVVMQVPCDRCGDRFPLKVSFKDRLIVKLSEEPQDYDGEMLVLSFQDHSFNVAFYIYECIALNTPARKVHKSGECNQEAIEKLENFKRAIKNDEDPRWDALKNINLQ